MIIFVAYLVGLPHLPHLIAGDVEIFYLVLRGELSPWTCFGGYLVPTLLGKVIGGVALRSACGVHFQRLGREEAQPLPPAMFNE